MTPIQLEVLNTVRSLHRCDVKTVAGVINRSLGVASAHLRSLYRQGVLGRRNVPTGDSHTRTRWVYFMHGEETEVEDRHPAMVLGPDNRMMRKHERFTPEQIAAYRETYGRLRPHSVIWR